MKKRLALGTAQLGMNYGITNYNGLPTETESINMLNKAIDAGINTLDTAQEYGDSEKIIGRSGLQNKFNIITKMKIRKNEDGEDWDKKCLASQSNLNTECIGTVLIHNSLEIDKETGEKLTKWAQSAKTRNIRKIGLSIYKETELRNVDLKYIDAVQLPISIYNQEHIQNGLVKKLKSLGIEVQARSCFMQGLILTENQNWPKLINGELRNHHKIWEEIIKERGITKLEGCLEFCKRNQSDIIIIGATSCKELDEIINAWKRNLMLDMDFEKWSWNIKEHMDPRNWK